MPSAFTPFHMCQNRQPRGTAPKNNNNSKTTKPKGGGPFPLVSRLKKWAPPCQHGRQVGPPGVGVQGLDSRARLRHLADSPSEAARNATSSAGHFQRHEQFPESAPRSRVIPSIPAGFHGFGDRKSDIWVLFRGRTKMMAFGFPQKCHQTSGTVPSKNSHPSGVPL